jgi:3'-phosphoadenosine 5'-phosphosulfate sulfotransferase (PAPS reductase)/FAD synthetase
VDGHHDWPLYALRCASLCVRSAHLPDLWEAAVIALPDQLAGLPLIVSMSGGKDSTATALALKEAGLTYTMVFADTGWEAAETYKHLDMLMREIGPIDVVGVVGGMVAKIKHRAGFPARMQRWCTRELKIEPLRKFHEAVADDTVSVVGVRAAESESRAKMPECEDDPQWGGWVWRPLIRWTVEEVLAIHHRHGIEVNPLYKRGHNRVGCFPCVYSNKEDIRLVAEHAPERIDLIRQLEAECVDQRRERNEVKPGRYAYPDEASFFQSREGDGRLTNIDKVVEWSRTSHGGKQLPLIQPPPPGGCFKWGLCEPPGEPE